MACRWRNLPTALQEDNPEAAIRKTNQLDPKPAQNVVGLYTSLLYINTLEPCGRPSLCPLFFKHSIPLFFPLDTIIRLRDKKIYIYCSSVHCDAIMNAARRLWQRRPRLRMITCKLCYIESTVKLPDTYPTLQSLHQSK